MFGSMKPIGKLISRTYSLKAGGKYDAVIIGGGHNGLIAAAYLKKAGHKVCVLERRHIVGGAAVTEEIIPGFQFSRASYVLSLLRPQIYRDLKLQEYGLRVIPRDPSSYTPLRTNLWKGNAKSLLLGTDSKRNAMEISKFSELDAQTFATYEALLGRIANAIDPLLDISSSTFARLLTSNLWGKMAILAREDKLRKAITRFVGLKSDIAALYELITASPLKILQRSFESEVLITTLAMDAIIGTVESPHASGTGYVLLLHSMLGECDGGRGRWGYPVGGMGSVSKAIAAAAQDLGVDLFTDKTVSAIVLDGSGSACGVQTADGHVFESRVVLSNATPKVTFLDLLPPSALSASFIKSLNTIDYSSGVTKINVAVNKLPNFTADPNVNELPLPHHQTTIHINSEKISCISDAHNDLLNGRYSKRPVVEMVIPSVLDETIAPKGGHVVLLFTQYTPYYLEGRPWTHEDKEDYSNVVFSLIDEYAPGFSKSVIGKEVLTPSDIENIFGLTGGNIFHGSMSPDRLFFLRSIGLTDSDIVNPLTPVPRLFLCGSGSHPGGGVSGAPGRLAAEEVVKFLALNKE